MTGDSPCYEYEVVYECKRTGKPFVAPKAWSHPITPRPIYPTCRCHRIERR